jgi:phosphoribosyl 1,2-cyclic phosphodiesterase
MALRVVSLASGSSANCMYLEADGVRILIDAGLSAKAICSDLEFMGVNPNDLTAILLTHEHGDHLRSVKTFNRRHKVPVVANQRTLAAAGIVSDNVEVLPTGQQLQLGPLSIRSFAIPHDSREPVGYFIECGDWHVCFATDLGHAPKGIEEYLRQSDLMILEANHDRQQLINGPYPAVLKSRILSDYGHLSNDATAELLTRSISGRPQWVWLAHLSEVNNHPRKAERCVKNRLSLEGVSSVTVSVAERDRRSLTWQAGEAFMQLPFGNP